MLTYLEVYSSLSSAPDLPLVVGGATNDDQLQIRDIDGLGPVKAAISTQTYATQDGEFLTGATLGKRNIVLNLGFNPDWVENTVSSLRQKLYAYFGTRQEVKLRFFRDDNPSVEIMGVVESCEPNIFSQDPEMQISVLCPQPDFVAVNASEVYGVAGVDPETTDFTLRGSAVSPVLLTLTSGEDDAEYDGSIVFEFGTLFPDVYVFEAVGTVDPVTDYVVNGRGEKVVENVFDDEHTSLLTSVTLESVWPYLSPGTNKVRVVLETATDVPWTLTYYERFGGL